MTATAAATRKRRSVKVATWSFPVIGRYVLKWETREVRARGLEKRDVIVMIFLDIKGIFGG